MMEMLVCITEGELTKMAKYKPIGFLDDCSARSTRMNDMFCFTLAAWSEISALYDRYKPSVAESHLVGERISGCCDRADQY